MASAKKSDERRIVYARVPLDVFQKLKRLALALSDELGEQASHNDIIISLIERACEEREEPTARRALSRRVMSLIERAGEERAAR